MLFFDLLMAQFTSVNSFAGRIGLYFSMFEIQAFPLIYDKSRRKIIVFMCLIGYMLFYWWFYYVLNGANATVGTFGASYLYPIFVRLGVRAFDTHPNDGMA